MKKIALLVVDVQNALIKANPYNEIKMIANIKKLISKARKNNIEIIYVRHNDEKGSDLELGSEGWQIYDEIAPESNEKIFDKKFNSAFVQTGLHDYFKKIKIEALVLMGLQTELCIDATCKGAFDCGYKVIIPEETNSSFDNECLTAEKIYQFYHYKIWHNRFAQVTSVEATIKLLQ